jgi:lipopolysaccharide export system ATP-binding protein
MAPPRSWTANVLDELRSWFRLLYVELRGPNRKPKPRPGPAKADSLWRINLATLGGLIGFGRSDAIPRSGPQMRVRPRQRSDAEQPAQPYTQHAEPRGWQQPHTAAAAADPYAEQNYQPQADHRYLAAHAVEKSFANRTVVKGASLYVRRGEAVGLLGPNGAGKTTIFYMITGLIQADRGRVELDGHDVTTLPMYQRARLGIGYLPQEASIFRGLTVEENIRAVLEVVEPNRRRRERDLDALLDEFNITRLRKTPSIALSGGERHRSDRGRRHPGAGTPPHQPRHRRADHRPQRPRNARPDRSGLHHLLGRGADGGPHRRHRQQSGGPAALSRRGIPPVDRCNKRHLLEFCAD